MIFRLSIFCKRKLKEQNNFYFYKYNNNSKIIIPEK